MPFTDRHGNLHDPQGRFQRKPTPTDADLPGIATQADIARSRCIQFAKRHEIDMIWRTASIEVRGITFPDTARLFSHVNPEDPVEVNKVMVVNNIKRAWSYLVDHVDDPLDWTYLTEYNRIIGQYLERDPGSIRRSPVRIGGTSWTPPGQVTESQVFEGMEEARAEQDPTRRASHMFAVVCRGQWFYNGNKRTAIMAANHSIIHDGAGIFALPPQTMKDDTFADQLLHYYETGQVEDFLNWLDYHAIGRLSDGCLTRAQLDHKDTPPHE